MKSFTAIIKKGEKQFVALCPELDVVSQGYTVEEAIKNLKEAVELYIEEMGLPEGFFSNDTIVVNFGVEHIDKINSENPIAKKLIDLYDFINMLNLERHKEMVIAT